MTLLKYYLGIYILVSRYLGWVPCYNHLEVSTMPNMANSIRSSPSIEQYFPLTRTANKNGINRRSEASAEVAQSDLLGGRKNMSLKRKLRDMDISNGSVKRPQLENGSSSTYLGYPQDPKTTGATATVPTIPEISYAETISSDGQPESSTSSRIPLVTSDLSVAKAPNSVLSANINEWRDDDSEQTEEQDWSASESANDKTWQPVQQACLARRRENGTFRSQRKQPQQPSKVITLQVARRDNREVKAEVATPEFRRGKRVVARDGYSQTRKCICLFRLKTCH
jgi:hypothetical protein